MHVAADMHRHGINVRHMGLVRDRFWRPLKGTVDIMFNDRRIKTRHDLRNQVKRGMKVSIRGSRYMVSTDPADEFSDTVMTLDRKVAELSVNEQTILAGMCESEHNSFELRLLLLAEMAARTVKNVLRYYLRNAAKRMKLCVHRVHMFILTEFLNIVTGAHEKAEDFWANQLFHGIRVRFGVVAVSVEDRINLRHELEPCTVYIVSRLQAMLNVQLTQRASAHFHDEPIGFRFVPDDIQLAGPAIKHNIPVLDFAAAELLAIQANDRRVKSYEKIVTDDRPLLYLKCSERRGSRVAFNRGEMGMSMSGFYTRTCKLEATGPIVNDDMNRAVHFSPDAKSRIDTKYLPEIAPLKDEAQWSIECWCRCIGSEGLLRIVVMSGRYSLCATRENKWCFTIFSGLDEAHIDTGIPVVEKEWVHLVGTYDGTMARLWLDSKLMAELEVAPEILNKRREKEEDRQQAAEVLEAQEKRARDHCKKQTDEQAAAFFKTQEGQTRMRQAAMKLMEHADFKLKMDAHAAEKGLKKLSKREAQTMARAEYRTALYMRNVQAVAEQFRRRREELVDSRKKDDEEAQERGMKPLRVGAACASKRAKEGRNFFDGDICHVAMYPKCLSADRIRAHYISGVQERSYESDRLNTAAAAAYQAALEFAPNDAMVLNHYASSLCNNLLFDAAKPDTEKRSMRKVSPFLPYSRTPSGTPALPPELTYSRTPARTPVLPPSGLGGHRDLC